jgi:hypothetical protein
VRATTAAASSRATPRVLLSLALSCAVAEERG